MLVVLVVQEKSRIEQQAQDSEVELQNLNEQIAQAELTQATARTAERAVLMAARASAVDAVLVGLAEYSQQNARCAQVQASCVAMRLVHWARCTKCSGFCSWVEFHKRMVRQKASSWGLRSKAATSMSPSGRSTRRSSKSRRKEPTSPSGLGILTNSDYKTTPRKKSVLPTE